MSPVLLVFIILLLAVTGVALRFGGSPERIAAAIILAGSALSGLTLSPIGIRFRSLEIGELIIDVVMWAVLTTLALRADRYWTLWISGLQGAQVLSHMAGLMGSASFNLAYAILSQVYCFPMLGLLAVGTFRHRRRLANYGVDNSWSRSSGFARPPSRRNAPSG